MDAVWYESFGAAADTLMTGSQPKPTPGAGEVLVKVMASGVNPSDVKKRAGSFPNALDGGFIIPHSDGAGVIEAVGEGVDPSRVGERVFLYQAQFGRRFGTSAQYVSVAENRAPRLPDEASFEEGACIGIPILTAHRCVFADGDVAGQTIVVTGGAGRVGYYAIQWAKSAGATVIATASNPDDEAACRAIGADHVVNHRSENWGEDILKYTNGEKVDRIVDVEFGANLPESIKYIRIGGTIATYSSTVVTEPKLPFFQMMFLDLTLRLVIVYSMPEEAKTHAIEDTTKMLEAGKLKHRIPHVVPLSDMVKAHELIEQGGFGGCVIVTPN